MNILRMRFWLMLLALLAIVAVHAGLAATISATVRERLVLHEAEMLQEFLNSILAAETSASALFVQPSPSPALLSFAGHVRSLPGTIRANIYAPDGFIRFSTEAGLTGKQFGANPELAEAFGGHIIAKLEDVTSKQKDEQIALNRQRGEMLIETYVPVKGSDGAVVTVVEYYRAGGMVEDLVRDIRLRVWFAAALSAAILFALFAAIAGLRRRQRN